MKLKFVPILALSAGLAGIVAPAMALDAANDAQSVYSAQDVGVARRAFRAQCLRYQPADQCECYTAGFAQALSVPEMRLATALLPARFGHSEAAKARALTAANRKAAGMGLADEAARTDAMTHIDTVEKDLANACIKVDPPAIPPAAS